MYNFYLKKLIQPPGCIRKLLLVMKITTLILFLAIMQVSATTLAQKVTLKANNQPLSIILDQISSQTGYDFAYTTKTLERAKPVTINVKNEELADVLQKIFQDQPLEFSIKDKFVSITVKQPTILDKLASALNLDKIEVNGRVLDEHDQSLAGATIIVKGTGNSTTTDVKGYFNLKNVDPKGILAISFIGYEKKELKPQTDMGTIYLKVASNPLDAVQIVAYGQTSERVSTGNISTVTSKSLEEQPVSDPILDLEGRVPGLFIAQATGFPGTGIQVQIQGQNSISQGNDPLYVIDGVPYVSQLVNGLNTEQVGTFASSPSPFAFLNPSDIESITILKDAGATSIYGSRATNGVVLITTKKGKAGATQVNFNLKNGWSSIPKELNMMNTRQYLQMRNQALTNDGITAGPTDYDINGLWDTTSYTDWQKVLLGGNAQYTDFQGSISGGNDRTQFLVGTGYQRQTEVFPGNYPDIKGSLHFSLNNTSENQRLKFQLTGSYLYDNNHLGSDLTSTALSLAPDAPALRNSDGTLNWSPDANGNSSWNNPLSYEEDLSRISTNSLNSNSVISYNFFKGFDAKVSLGFVDIQSSEISETTSLSQPPETRGTFPGYSGSQNNNSHSWIIEPQLNYNTAMGGGKLTALLGATGEQEYTNGTQVNASGFSSDLLLGNLGSASSWTANTVAASVYKYDAIFGQVNYNWNDKYILNISGRRDGSSRFGEANQFHLFGAAGASWIFSKEKIFADNFTFLSFGKLSVSYGTTGNDQIGNYAYLSTYSSVPYVNPYQGISSLTVNGLSNPFLEWELTKKANFALALGAFKDRILLKADYYVNRSSNELLNYKLPYITGTNGVLENFPAVVQNSGWEFSLNTSNINSGSFKWSTNVNLTIPENKLVAFPNLASSTYATSLFIGQPINVVTGFQYAGVNATTGQYQFVTAGGQKTSSPTAGTDYIAQINPNPKFYGGIQNTITYKSLSLDFLFQFVKRIGNDAVERFGNLPGYFSGTNPDGNQPASIAGAWSKPGQVATVQQYDANFTYVTPWINAYTSNAAFTDASYIRLKNLSLSWTAPDSWKKKIHARNFRIYIQGENLLTFTHYPGLDPEIAASTFLSFATLPPLRVIACGIQLGL